MTTLNIHHRPARRSFLKAAAVLAPAIILTPGLLMRVKPLEVLRPGYGPFVTGVDLSAGYDYSAWVTMQHDSLTGILTVVDWGPKDRANFRVTGASLELANLYD